MIGRMEVGGRHVVYLGLGSNLGDRAGNIAAAVAGLTAAGVSVRQRSPVYETEPVGVREQPAFLNAVVEAETGLTPRGLLAAAKAVEREVGRTPGPRWGPRVVDVDVLLYEDWRVDEAEPWLVIPHPEMWRRLFVLAPLRDLRPDLAGPDGRAIGLWVAEMQAKTPGAVRRVEASCTGGVGAEGGRPRPAGGHKDRPYGSGLAES
jgi:2-amino-4-hydroxy-6-hydroxymethyldihydropteridine diphosphokinase